MKDKGVQRNREGVIVPTGLEYKTKADSKTETEVKRVFLHIICTLMFEHYFTYRM